MGLAEEEGDAVVELAGEEGAGEVVEEGAGAEVVAEPEFGEFEMGLPGDQAEVGGGVFAEVSGVGGIVADDFKGAVAGEVEETFAKAEGIGGLEEDGAAGAEPGGGAGEDAGGGGVEMLEDFGHDDDVVGGEMGPGGGVGGLVEVEVDVLAVELAREAVVEVAEGVDGGVGEGFLELEGLVGEADVEKAGEGALGLADALKEFEQELVAALMELQVLRGEGVHRP